MTKETAVVTTRVSSALLERLDTLVTRLEDSPTHAHQRIWTRSELVRFLLARGVDELAEELDQEEGQRPL